MAKAVGHSVKWLSAVSVWLFVVMVIVLTVGKVSLLWLLRLYKYEQIHPATWYVLTCTLLTAPHVANLLYIVWNTPFISSAWKRRSPHSTHVYLGLISSVIEAVSATIFTTELSSVLPETVLLFLPAAVFTIPLIVNAAQQLRMKSTSKLENRYNPVRHFIVTMVCTYTVIAPATASAVLFLWSPFNMNLGQCMTLPVVLVLLSTAWTPCIQKLTTCSSLSSRRNWKACLTYAVLKIAATSVTVFATMVLKIAAFREDMIPFITSGLSDLSDSRVWLPVMLCMFSGLLALMLMNIASKVSLTTPGMMLPSLISPLLAFGAATVIWGDVESLSVWELSGGDRASWLAAGLVCLAWLLPFVTPSLNIIKSPTDLLRPFSENFFGFHWNQMFLEQSIILNFFHQGIRSTGHPSKTPVNKNSKTIFICTTMFRETFTEMTRYVQSLRKVYSSDQFCDVSMETHIFMDSAFVENELNGYANQLLSALLTTLDLPFSSLACYKTPYGCQVMTVYKHQYIIYIHMKNTEYFKAKKRWSQVMYMNYILKYRCNLPSTLYDRKKVSTDSENFESFLQGIVTDKDGLYKEAARLSRVEATVVQSDLQYEPSYDSGSELSTEASDAYTVSRDSGSYNTSEANDSDDSDLFYYHTCKDRARRAKSGEQLLIGKILSTAMVNNRDGVEKKKTPLPPGVFYLNPKSIVHGQWRKQNSRVCSGGRTEQTAVFTIPEQTTCRADDVYILATDADTQFNAKSVRALFDLCEKDRSLGAACGRTIPIGATNPIVWYQKFEYSKDFWLVKASQNIIGSVTCCPGCFSLYRGQALYDIMNTFSEPSMSAFDALVKDHGEDRWLCTLMMLRGWKLEYIDHCRNSTHCPERFTEFLRQRRRWVLSELSNMLLIFKRLVTLVRSNANFSVIFIMSLLQMFVWVLVSPSTTLFILSLSYEVLFGVPVLVTIPATYAALLGYAVVCCVGSRRTQNSVTLAFLVIVSLLMLSVGAAFIKYVVDSIQEDLAKSEYQFKPYFLVLLLISGTIYAALVHPGEWKNLVYGVAYAFMFPAMFVILPVYSVANMVDQSWGTREKTAHLSDYWCGCINAEKDVESEFVRLPVLSPTSTVSKCEMRFWESLKSSLLGTTVNCGVGSEWLHLSLTRLRNKCITLTMLLNTAWLAVLSSLYLFANTDLICYAVAGVFSFSLVVQLVGLTSYKIDNSLRRHVMRKAGSSHRIWIKERQ